MKRLFLVAVALILGATPILAAQQVVLEDAERPFEIAVTHADAARTVIHYDINRFALETVEVLGGSYSAVTLSRRALTMERGLPALPTLRESIVIPDDAEMSVRVLDAEYRDFAGVDVAPSKGTITRNVDPAMVSHVLSDFYGQDAWYPTKLAGLDEPYIMRDTRGIVVELNPFRYNPATHTLRVFTSITLEVSAVGPGKVNILESRPAERVAEFERIYGRHYLNYNGISDRYTPVPEGGSMLIVTHDAYHSAVQPLADWKNQMGLPTNIVDMSSIGSTGNQLKSYIQNRYDTDGVCYILLVGDDIHIPYLTNNGDAADPMQCLLAGSDSYPEAFIGRMSAGNATDVTTQVTKAIEYERDAQAGASWYHKGIGVASAEGSGIGDDGEADWQHMDNIRDDLLGFGYTIVDRIYDTNGGNSSQVSNAVNEGRSIINYCGHGSTTAWSTTGFNNNHVNALVNDNLLPWIVSVACVNGNFTGSTCFAEAWLRATHNGEPTGAVGMYASTINMQWATPMCGQDEIIDLLGGQAKRTVGGLCFNGSCQMMDEYGYNGQSEFKNWTIFGDPSLRVRTDTPSELTVSHDGMIESDAVSYTVITEPGALVGLSDAGTYLGSAVADGGGTAEVTIVGTLPEDELTLTVSHFNRFTHIETVTVGSLLIPTCEVDPTSFSEILLPDQVFGAQLFISNFGEAGSVLDYSIKNLDLDSGLGSPPDWLSLDSYDGQVPHGETDIIELSFDTSGMEDGFYNAELQISSNAVNMVVVPVVLEVTSDLTPVEETPRALALNQNYPNPFNPKTSIRFTLPTASEVTLEVFSASGQRVRTLVSSELAAGAHVTTWDGNDEQGQALGTGVYFYRIEAQGLSLTRKMILLK